MVHPARILLTSKGNNREDAVTRNILILQSAAIHKQVFRSLVNNIRCDNVWQPIEEVNIVDSGFDICLLKAEEGFQATGAALFYLKLFKVL